jgi:dinuclear metal center YbgI/SA1388 family protein
MVKVQLETVVRYCNHLLRPEKFEDWPGAVNGLQVENRGKVTRIAAAVDASLATVRLATAAGADLLLVHHGLFWGQTHPWTGKRYELIDELWAHGLAVYSAHLPLDAHPRLGNNALLCSALGLKRLRPFFLEKGRFIGWKSALPITRDNLARRLGQVLGHDPIVLPGGPARCRFIGVVTGGAGEQLKTAVQGGVDTFITGEGPHWTYALAEELGLNVFYGGHYATETLGVKALAEHLGKRFHVPWQFIDYPTGL